MTQNLYYLAASSSLSLVQGNEQPVNWSDISSLIVCSSLYEIIAFSGSTRVVAFPIEDTNIYYTQTQTQSPPVLTPTLPTQSYSQLRVNFSLTNVADADTGSSKFFITSSNYKLSASGYTTSTVLGLVPANTYTIGITGSGTYDATLYIYDTTSGSLTPPTFPGYTLAVKSGSNVGVSASVLIEESHNYIAYLNLVGALP